MQHSQKETPFSLTYDSEAIIPISETNVTKDDRGRIKEVDKRRGSKEIASIKEAYYQSKLCRHHSERSSHSIYNVGDFVLLSQNNTGSTQVWQGPHMVSEVQGRGLYKIVYASDHLLTQIEKGVRLKSPKVMTREAGDIIDKMWNGVPIFNSLREDTIRSQS
ncbi:hypothetical protein Tco_0508685 [Tanacetum coccineum]